MFTVETEGEANFLMFADICVTQFCGKGEGKRAIEFRNRLNSRLEEYVSEQIAEQRELDSLEG